MKKRINIIEYDDEAQEIRVKYLGNIKYNKIYSFGEINTTEGESENPRVQD
jgi:hypothetical protein